MSESDPAIGRALSIVRAVWALAAASQVMLLVAVLVAAGRPINVPGSNLHPLLLYLSVAVLIGGTMLAYFARTQFYKRYWRGHAITPTGYLAGNLVLLAILAGASILALVSALVVQMRMPYVLVSGVALAIMLLNLPRGRPMQPHKPRLGGRW